MAFQAHTITVNLGESTFVQSRNWERFDFGAFDSVVPIPTENHTVTVADVIKPDPVVKHRPDPVVSDPDDPDDPDQPVPPDPYRLLGTANADRFELTAGYDQGYLIANFGPGDVIVIDGASAGVTADDLADPAALTWDALDKFFYDQASGALSVSNVLSVIFASETSANGMDSPALTVADFVIV
jgi:hypothetical protein